MSGVSNFSSVSGLLPNKSKSCCFFGNVPENVCSEIVNTLGFQRGSLPINYLGLPLVTSKLSKSNCLPLVNRFSKKIENWTTKSLNFGGRLQLVNTVLGGMLSYWYFFLFLPQSTLQQLNSIMFKFLWGGYHKPTGRCHYKVNWIDCCTPKEEGGLGIKNLFVSNSSAIFYQLWRII
ncbi:hypothetical protein DCAR_0831409 [Daucus carota subsp. sativus]|uniref:Reverse transcriptase zinc-binding domain-containing protein n=1 Tax=Daucus carota subsp. sativus TaxID=79200 RepID=A0AAF0XPL4_DAUCS|nr:hypothetical protein DCAR_0831409 [Daucus carota subsp. sativus]